MFFKAVATVALLIAVSVPGCQGQSPTVEHSNESTAEATTDVPSQQPSAPQETSSTLAPPAPSAKPSQVYQFDGSQVRQHLEAIPVGADGTMEGYSASTRPILFPHWMPNNKAYGWLADYPKKCSSRYAALWREAHKVKWVDQKQCWMSSEDGGFWQDRYGYINPYTGKMDPYLNSDDVELFDIDHIVALGAAWRQGAKDWPLEARKAFANDAMNLSVSDARVNRGKGDQTADTYLPPGEFRCEYASRVVEVKHRFNSQGYRITMNPAEKARLAQTLDQCGIK